jgi:hypothetical protein
MVSFSQYTFSDIGLKCAAFRCQISPIYFLKCRCPTRCPPSAFFVPACPRHSAVLVYVARGQWSVARRAGKYIPPYITATIIQHILYVHRVAKSDVITGRMQYHGVVHVRIIVLHCKTYAKVLLQVLGRGEGVEETGDGGRGEGGGWEGGGLTFV